MYSADGKVSFLCEDLKIEFLVELKDIFYIWNKKRITQRRYIYNLFSGLFSRH